VIHETDVLVVGSGPGGLAAAIAAARTGARVALLERFGCFGGNITAVGVESFSWYRYPATVEAGGIGREFEDRAKAETGKAQLPDALNYELDSEGFKVVADRLVEDAGIHPMLHRQFVAPVMKNGAVAGIIAESKAGREAILAHRVIDATGDADVAHRAGAPTVRTPVEHMQAASVIFHLAGVDKQKFIAGVRADPQTFRDWSTGEWTVETAGKEDDLFSPFLKKPFEQAIRDGVIPARLNTIAGTWGSAHDTGELTYMNLIHLAGCDGTDPDSLTRFEIEGRKQAMAAIEALRRYAPGCSGARLRNFGMTIGIRDTRKVDALYNLTETDVRDQARFDDTIGIYPEFIDGYGILILPTTGRYMQIPYRSLLPRGIDNLIVAGRSVGGDRIAHAATRNMSCCALTGQAAGIAAALSVRSGTPLDRIPLPALHAELVRQGVRIR
ncbi:MAG TPA: FAD-dependent oxidoreductase, partial [Acidiphilium sp.]